MRGEAPRARLSVGVGRGCKASEVLENSSCVARLQLKAKSPSPSFDAEGLWLEAVQGSEERDSNVQVSLCMGEHGQGLGRIQYLYGSERG